MTALTPEEMKLRDPSVSLRTKLAVRSRRLLRFVSSTVGIVLVVFFGGLLLGWTYVYGLPSVLVPIWEEIAGNKPSYSLAITKSMMFDRCLRPIENGAPLVVHDLDALPTGDARSLESKSNGKAWLHPNDYPVLINLETVYDRQQLRGCRVQYGVDERTPASFHVEITSAFEEWANGAIEEGRYVEFPVCGDMGASYHRNLQSNFPRDNDNFVRVFLHVHDDLDYFFFVAAETPTKFTECGT